jgi:hypothetical protein
MYEYLYEYKYINMNINTYINIYMQEAYTHLKDMEGSVYLYEYIYMCIYI